MTDTDKAIERLKRIGYTDSKITELLSLLLPDVADKLLIDLTGTANEDELARFEIELKQASTPEDQKALLLKMMRRAYGEEDEARSKLDKEIAQKLNEAADLTEKVRATYHAYMNGDPNTKKAVEDYAKSDEARQILQDMDAAGFDFRAAAAE